MIPTIELHGGKFHVAAHIEHEGQRHHARAIHIAEAPETVLLCFFSQSNPELMVKVLDGAAINGHWWAFVAKLTDLPVTLTVTDQKGRRWSAKSPGGAPFQPVSDTQAFAASASSTETTNLGEPR